MRRKNVGIVTMAAVLGLSAMLTGCSSGSGQTEAAPENAAESTTAGGSAAEDGAEEAQVNHGGGGGEITHTYAPH